MYNDYLTRENLETAAIVVAAISALIALGVSIRSNSISQSATVEARRSADSSEASTQIAKSALRLAEDQWLEYQTADLFVNKFAEHYSEDIRSRNNLDDYDYKRDGISVHCINRGVSPALDVRHNFYLFRLDGSIQPREEPQRTRSIDPGEESVFSFNIDIESFKSIAHVRMVIAYRDIKEHIAVFDFDRHPGDQKNLRLVRSFLDGQPNANQRLHHDTKDLSVVGQLHPHV